MRRDPSKRTLVPRRRASQASSAAPQTRPAEPSSSRIEVAPIPVRNGVVSLTGYGVHVSVHNGQLVLADGIGNRRREGSFSRATSCIKRIIIRGDAGFITFDALQWLTDVGASFTNLDYDGQVIASWSPPGHNDGRLRRSLALSPWTDSGIELIRYLIGEKLKGRMAVVEQFFSAESVALASIHERLERIDSLGDAELIRHAEGEAGAAYWELWRRVPVAFARRDLARIPEHWLTFGPRMSPLSSGRPRRAATPGNAALNYLYGVAGSEVRAACTAAGLDVGLGLLHTDTLNRDSLVYDLMEPIRPQVESWFLELLASRVWTKNDFTEVRDGVCRVMPDLAHQLAQTGLAWYRAVAPHVEHVARVLATARFDMPGGRANFRLTREGGERYPTRLTNANRLWSKGKGAPRDPRPKAPPSACHNCGVILANRRRQYCADCLLQLRNERALLSTASETKRRVSLSNSHAARRTWEREHPGPYDEEWYTTTVLPLLQSRTLPAMSDATGLSIAYCSQVRAGKVPHPMHWEALAKLDARQSRASRGRRFD
jgi:CRISPR-associated endonuclease Cas1